MATAQQIVVQLDPTSLMALKDLGYALYALQGFAATNAEGEALIWFETTAYAESTVITSTTAYAAYVEGSAQTGAGVITMMVATPAALGDIVTFADNALTASAGGYPSGVTIVNTTTTPYAAGLSTANPQAAGGEAAFAAVPLHGLAEAIIAPLGLMLVTFSTAGSQIGAPLPYSMSQSLLITLADQTQLEAAFDINKGWDFNGTAWGKTVPAGADLFAVLVKAAPLT